MGETLTLRIDSPRFNMAVVSKSYAGQPHVRPTASWMDVNTDLERW